MRILVTGGAGFIASHIVDQYVAAGHEVTIVDNFWSHGGGREKNVNPRTTLYQADVRDQAKLAEIFDQVRPEVVSHHAAQHSVAVSTREPAYDAEVNILGLINILQNASRVKSKKIIFASSMATYGSPVRLPLDEDTLRRPESPYGISKMAGEHYIRYWAEANNLKYTILRYANVYGTRQDPNGEAGVISIFAQRFLNKQPVRIDWDGEQKKDYVYVTDIARANLLSLQKGDNEVFCIGSGQGISVNALYQHLARVTGNKPDITRAPKRPGDIYQSYYNCARAERLLGWKPEISFETGIKQVIEFFQQQQVQPQV